MLTFAWRFAFDLEGGALLDPFFPPSSPAPMRSRHLALLSWIGLVAACAQGGAAGNTEITLTIGDNLGAAPGQAAFEADRVDYRVTCAGTPPGTLPIPPDGSGLDPVSDDSVDISGAFEIIDANNPPVWQSLMDLPPGDCTISLSVYRNGQMVCLGSRDFTVVEDGTTTVSISLLCELGIDIPEGGSDAEGDFQFEIGNECPKLFDLSAHPSVIPLGSDSTVIQVVAQDLDGTCGDNCDPQTCTDTNPPVCTPGPDTGMTTTFASLVGTIGDPNAALTTYTCDPAFPGPMEVCVTVTDGDLDCDKTQCMAVVCPDPCAGITCDDGNECTHDYCDPTTEQCVFDPAPNGIACNNCNNTCVSGSCIGSNWLGAQVGSIMSFVGSFRFVNGVYVNPYDNFYIIVPTTYVYYNTTTYEGVSTNDTITGTPSGDYLLLSDPFFVAEQTVCGVEQFLAGSAGDFAHFADLYIRSGDMAFSGQNADDVIWANWGNDFLNGGNGNDTLDGGPGDDVILGGAGLDHITMGYDNGVDSVFGGPGFDEMSINALASQITILPAGDAGYEFDIFYLSSWVAQIAEVEQFNTIDTSIDLTACVAGVCDLCGNGMLNGGEQCDDGNTTSGDGCASDCTVE